MKERAWRADSEAGDPAAVSSLPSVSDGEAGEAVIAKSEPESSEKDYQYRAVFEASSDGLVITDLDSELVLEANPAFCRMHGYDDMVGVHPSTFIHPNSHHLFGEYLQAIREGREFRCRAQDIHRDGSIFDVEVVGRSFSYRGKPAVLGLVRDITDQVRAYQLLEERVAERTREIERRRVVAEGLRDLLVVVNTRHTLNDVLEYVVAQSRKLLGSDASAIFLPVDEANKDTLCAHASSGLEEGLTHVRLPVHLSSMGLALLRRRPVVLFDIPDALPPASGPAQELELEEGPSYIRVTRLPTLLDEPGDPERGEPRRPLRSFARQFCALLAVPLVVKDEGYGTLALHFREPRTFSADEVALTSAFADQAALAIENARLREQAEQAAVLEERQRLARDLHDAVTQTLFSASLLADVIPDLWEVDPVEARRRLKQLRGLTRGALAEMRLLLVELRPGALSELPLADLLRQLADAVGGATGADVAVQTDGFIRTKLPPDVHVALYRIAQEALNNVVKHASAKRVEIQLRSRADGGAILEIRDDGRGFQPEDIPAGHLGVAIMRERAQAIGARFELASNPGRGTRIEVSWCSEQGIES